MEKNIKVLVHKGRIEIINSISFFALCLLVIDCAISGGGKWLTFGPLSLRMVLGGIALVCAIPAILKSVGSWTKNPLVIGVAAFIVLLVISTVLGYIRGNRMSLILTDIKGFAWLFLVPVALVVVNSKSRLYCIMKCLIGGAVIQSILILIMNFIMLYTDGAYWFNVYYTPIIQLQLGFIGNITSTMFRIFSKSGPYLIIGAVFMTYFQLQDKKFRWWYVAGIALCMNGVILSFTRSLYGAAGIAILLALVAVIIFCRHQWKRVLLHLSVAIAVFTALLATQQALSQSDYIKFAINRTLPNSTVETTGEKTYDEIRQEKYIARTKESDEVVRKKTIEQLKESIMHSPVIGNGLGAEIEYREDGLVEYFYFDIVNKMGVVGLILYCFPFGYMFYILINRKKRTKEDGFLGAMWVAGLSAFFAVTFFNPYMNASLGITVYALAMSGFTIIQEYDKIQTEEIAGKINSGHGKDQIEEITEKCV